MRPIRPHSRGSAALVAALALVATASGCTGAADPDPTAEPPVDAEPDDPEPPDSATEPEPAPDPEPVPDPEPPVVPAPDDAPGEGPGDGEDGTDAVPAPLLGDGRHPTYIQDIDGPGWTLTVDVIQFLTGQDAIDAYQADHPDDPEGPPNDYYILNVNPLLRTLPVADDVQVSLVRLHQDGDAGSTPGTWDELPGYLAEQQALAGGGIGDSGLMSWSPFWITVSSAVVVAIEEQYLP